MQQQQQQQTPCATIIDNETLIMTNTSLFHCDVTLYMLSLKKILFFPMQNALTILIQAS